jgi:hypothetical protein
MELIFKTTGGLKEGRARKMMKLIYPAGYKPNSNDLSAMI